MANWDEDSPKLRENLAKVMRSIRDGAMHRDMPTVETARRWQRDTMAGLDVPFQAYVGHFRGEEGLKSIRVWIGGSEGVAPNKVPEQLDQFDGRLKRALVALDSIYPRGVILDADGLSAAIDLAAWAHCEWIRIHPFANGNGRTARMWANAIFMRYGLEPVVRLRPRPDGVYGAASAAALNGNWQAAAVLFRKLLLAP